ncbi:hypothetical protein [Desulfomonile tiedjei]|nr:hypothetical protein [Desulfomonile tiedjei]
MTQETSSRDVGARAAIEAIRGPMTNAEIMARFKISALGFADLIRQLYERKLISESDMARRGLKYRIKKPVEKPPEPAPPPAPKPRIESEDGEFLDTIELAGMFTAFQPAPSDTPAAPKVERKDEPPQSPEEVATEKRSKFSITGMFKKK